MMQILQFIIIVSLFYFGCESAFDARYVDLAEGKAGLTSLNVFQFSLPTFRVHVPATLAAHGRLHR